MRLIGSTGAVLLLLGSAACNNASAPPPAEGPDVRAELRSMPQGQRDAVLIRAIRDAGQACQRVAASAYQSEVGTQSLWAAQCEGGSAWAVMVNRDGSAAVSPCALRNEGGQPVCDVGPR